VVFTEKISLIIALSLLLVIAVLSTLFYMTYLENLKLKKQVEMLMEKSRELESLKIKYEVCLTNATNLRNEYESLLEKLKEYETTFLQFKTISTVAFQQKLEELASKINERVYGGKNLIRPDDVEATVMSVVGHKFNEETLGSDLYSIFWFIVRNIKYSKDSVYPFIKMFNVSITDASYNITIEVEWVANVYQTPIETLKRKEGDCEDMAYLAASILQNYFEDRKDYEVYVLQVLWGEEGHAAAVVRHINGTIAIIDPAGKYFTGRVTEVMFKPAKDEILRWFGYWGIDETNFKHARFTSILGEAYAESIEAVIGFLD